MEFKKETRSLEERKDEALKILSAHATKIPVILEPHNSAHVLQQSRFLVPKNYTFQEFVFHIRKRMQIGAMSSLYITTRNQIPAMDHSIGKVYEEFKDPDGFLYAKYSSETVLG